MKSKLDIIFNIDRRIIFLFIFIAVLVPFLIDFNIPIVPSKNVKNIYNKIESIAANGGGTVLLSFDFDNASAAELDPMARSLLSHLFMRGIKVIGMGNWPNGVELTKEIFASMAKEYNKVNGIDYAYVGYKSGVQLLMINLSKDFQGAFPTDVRGEKTSEIPVTKNIRGIKDFDYVISLSAGSGGIEEWVIYAQSKYNFDFGGACTAVMAPDFFPFLNAGQLNGLIGGLAGAAQYEALINKPGEAIKGMKPQSVAHIILILFIIFGNFCYFYGLYSNKERRES